MSLKNVKYVLGPAGEAISLSVSKLGDIYAGWSTGAVMRLQSGSAQFGVYISGSTKPPINMKRRTSLSGFAFVKPVAIDAWGSKKSQFIGDSELNRIYEVDGETVTLIAGTGAKGCADGDSLTEASFDSLRSILVLSEYIAVLSASLTPVVRFIDRKTNVVTTLKTPKPVHASMVPFHIFSRLNPTQIEVVYQSEACNIVKGSCSMSTPGNFNKQRIRGGVNLFRSEEGAPYLIFITSTCTQLDVKLTPNAPMLRLGFDAALCHAVLPVYCPLSDTLIATRLGKLSLYQSFAGNELPNPKIIPSYHLSLKSVDVPNASSLLDKPIAAFKADLIIHHESSNTTFHLYRSILERSTLSQMDESSATHRFAEFIRTSTLSATAIHAFLEYRYFKPLQVESSLLVTFAGISKEVFDEDDSLVLTTLQRQIKAESDADVSRLLIKTWLNTFGDFNLDESSLIIAILLERVQKCPSTFKSTFDLLLASDYATNLLKLLPRITSLSMLITGSSKALVLPEITTSTSNLSPVAPASIEAFLSLNSTNIILQIPTSTCYSLGLSGWLLYLHWPWFKHLIDSGLQESKTRIITLTADSITRDGLATVLRVMLGRISPRLNDLETWDVLSILQSAEALGLVDNDGVPLPSVVPLIEACEARIFPPPTAANCWDQLQMAHSFRSPKYKVLLAFIADTLTDLPSSNIADLPEEVALDLFRKLKEFKRLTEMAWSSY